MSPNLVQLLSNAAATGAWVFFNGGIADFSLLGTLGGATVTLQKMGPDGATAVAVGASSTVTAVGEVQGLNLPTGVYRCSISGGPPSGLYATLAASLN